MNFDYSVNYTRKRSISVSISSANRITVNCPLGCPKETIESFLNRKRSWIEKLLQKNAQKMQDNADILSFEKIFVAGEKKPLILNGGKYGIFDDGVYLGDFIKTEYVYEDKFSADFCAKVREIAEECGLKPAFIKIKDYKSIWGCCNLKGYVCFNYKLFMLSPGLQRYVIIHELCHLRYMNHSKAFWQLVEKFMPDYREAKTEIKKYDFLTRLY